MHLSVLFSEVLLNKFFQNRRTFVYKTCWIGDKRSWICLKIIKSPKQVDRFFLKKIYVVATQMHNEVTLISKFWCVFFFNQGHHFECSILSEIGDSLWK